MNVVVEARRAREYETVNLHPHVKHDEPTTYNREQQSIRKRLDGIFTRACRKLHGDRNTCPIGSGLTKFGMFALTNRGEVGLALRTLMFVSVMTNIVAAGIPSASESESVGSSWELPARDATQRVSI